MKVNMVLQGEASTLLQFMELAISEKCFQSFTVVEGEIIQEEAPALPVPEEKGSRGRIVKNPRKIEPDFYLNDRVTVRYDVKALGVTGGMLGRVVETKKASHGWSCLVEFRSASPGIMPAKKWIPQSKLRLAALKTVSE